MKVSDINEKKMLIFFFKSFNKKDTTSSSLYLKYKCLGIHSN